jgi:hypothetical protein
MSQRRVLVVGLVLALAIGLAVAAWRIRGGAPDAPPASAIPSEPPAASPPPAEPEPRPAPAVPEPPSAEMPLGLAAVDLDEVRAALPDNLYWETSAPSDDPAVLEAREREKAFRNEQYGKILSGTGTDAEILDYYDYRMRASTDYIAFADYLLEHEGSDLTDQDMGLLLLAKKLHAARLEEIPRRVQVARERMAQQEEARWRWREEEAAFRGEGGGPR